MTHWRRNHESASNDLRSSDLYDDATSKAKGRDAYLSPVVLIEKMSVGKVKSKEKPNGESRNYAHFKGKQKPLGLNVTNCETLQALSGSPDTARWVGMAIQLYVDPAARYPSGKKGPAIRIRPERPKTAADTTALPDVPNEQRERLNNEQAERLDDEREPGEEG